jgi:hypothetical protein
MVVKSDPTTIAALEEQKREPRKEEDKEELEESKWSSVIRNDKRAKIPKLEEFPALSAESTNGPKAAWGAKPKIIRPGQEEFPSLATSTTQSDLQEFPSLLSPVKSPSPPKEVTVPPDKPVVGKGARKKKPKTVIKLAGGITK